MATKRLMNKRNSAPQEQEVDPMQSTREAIASFDYKPQGLKGTYNEWNSRATQYFQREMVTSKNSTIARIQRSNAKRQTEPFLERTSTPAAQRAPGSGARALMPVSKPQTSGIQDVNGGKWKGSFFYGEDE
jgi:hypothetical protein